jgi:hypothetical protein
MKIEAFGWVKQGILKIANRKRLDADLRAFSDCDVVIIIKRRGKRSSPQNRYYWGVVVDEVRRELKRRGHRYTPEEVHEALKLKFNPDYVRGEGGEVLMEMPGTTTIMNKEEFGGYLDRIIEWSAKSLEIAIPLPGTQTDMFNLNAA